MKTLNIKTDTYIEFLVEYNVKDLNYGLLSF